MEIYNIVNMPTFVTSTRQEVLDMTPGNTLMSKAVKNWRVLDELSMSDGRKMRPDVECNSETERSSGKVQNPRRTNWDSYARHLSNSRNDVYDDFSFAT